MSVDAVPIEGDPVRAEVAVLDDIAAKAHACGQLDCGAVALARIIIGDDGRDVMLQDGRLEGALTVSIAVTEWDSIARRR